MYSVLTQILATSVTAPSVPDSGSTGILLGIGILVTGLVARYVKNRKS